MVMTDNKRKFERYMAQLKIGLLSKDGHVYTSESSDISEGGMLLVVPETDISKLEKSGSLIAQGEDFRVSLSNPENTMEFLILCSIAHVSVNDQGQYLVGLQFMDKRDTLKTFIRILLKQFEA